MAQGDGGQVEWLDNIVESLRSLHAQILKESGGMQGEHTSSLYAACARPFQAVFEEELYPTPFEKVAAFFHSIICDHVFVDGNKRTATVGAIGALAAEGVIDIDDATPLQVRMLGEVALMAASEEMTVQQITYWLRRIFDASILPPPRTE